MTPGPEDVLRFWFEETPAKKRFATDPELDAEIARRFGALHAELSQDVPAAWTQTAHGLLAAVIVLDQFSRNLFRTDGRAYAQDAAAKALTERALAAGFARTLTPTELNFLYLPLMHSEDLADVERAQALLEAQPGLEDAVAAGLRHLEVIRRFGRYPARNRALGRPSTPEEAAFLERRPHGF